MSDNILDNRVMLGIPDFYNRYSGDGAGGLSSAGGFSQPFEQLTRHIHTHLALALLLDHF